MMDVRNTHSRSLRLRSFLKGARAEKQKADRYITWQSSGNKMAHHDMVTDHDALVVLFDRLFKAQHEFNIAQYGRADPFAMVSSGVYYIKSPEEN